MKKKFIALALLLVLSAPISASAAVDRAYLYNISPVNSTTFASGIEYLDGATSVNSTSFQFPIGTISNTAQLETAAKAAALTDAANWGYTLTNGVFWEIPQPSEIQAMIAAATSSLPMPVPMSFANPSRTLNSAFQVSATRASYVNYSVDIATSVSLAGGQVGTVFLEYANDSGFTSGVTEVGRFVNGQTGTLVVGLTLNQTNTAQVQGLIPAGKYVRLRTANTTGTPTFTFRSAQEVLMPSN